MNIELSEHFTYRKLLRFTFPSMVMMVLTSVYGVVDGFFISNFIGAEPFAAVNIIMPFSDDFWSGRFYDWYRRKCSGCF